MSTTYREEAVAAKQLLQEAKILMGLEGVAQRMRGTTDFGELNEFVQLSEPGVIENRRPRFRKLGKITRERIESISELRADAVLFTRMFGYRIPKNTKVSKRPYSMQFALPDAAYRDLCTYIPGLAHCADVDGFCMRPLVGGSIILVRKPSYTKLERHEEVHAFQNLMEDAKYQPFINGALHQDLLSEEAAECIAEAEHRFEPARERVLLHTSFYSRYEVPGQDFNALARRIHERYPSLSENLIHQRQKNEEALLQAYDKSDRELKKLIGWTLHLLEFPTADRVLGSIPSVYQTM
ncbi:MAG: hypothetical protein HY051_03060 [Candidatus Aenigmarchaeota archaeon]|nr:hypothetical protein [Candidatus Aenigmarchaeota archaeon]